MFRSSASSSDSILSYWISRSTAAKRLLITVTGRAKIMIPLIIVTAATSLPRGRTGTWSPYPTVVAVTMDHQKEAGMDVKGFGSTQKHFTTTGGSPRSPGSAEGDPAGSNSKVPFEERRRHPPSSPSRQRSYPYSDVTPATSSQPSTRHPSSSNSA